MNISQNTRQISSSLDFKNEVPLQELEQGMVNAARLVRRYGVIYWPIVERLQREIDAVEKRDALIAKLLDGDSKPSIQVSFG